jgi:hypothetical protein
VYSLIVELRWQIAALPNGLRGTPHGTSDIEGDTMPVSFTTCPFEVIADDNAGIVIEDRKTGQSWRLWNQQAREFGRLIGRHRRLAELAEYAPRSFGMSKPGG